MNTVILLLSIVLLLAAIRSHVTAQTHVVKKEKKEWFERLFTGDRACRKNLTQEGLRHRKQSNLMAGVAALLLCLYVWLKSTG